MVAAGVSVPVLAHDCARTRPQDTGFEDFVAFPRYVRLLGWFGTGPLALTRALDEQRPVVHFPLQAECLPS